jgi:hypothetical protein
MAGSKPDNSAFSHMHWLALSRSDSKSRAGKFRPPVVRNESDRPKWGNRGPCPAVRVGGTAGVETQFTEMIEPAKRTCPARARTR